MQVKSTIIAILGLIIECSVQSLAASYLEKSLVEATELPQSLTDLIREYYEFEMQGVIEDIPRNAAFIEICANGILVTRMEQRGRVMNYHFDFYPFGATESLKEHPIRGISLQNSIPGYQEYHSGLLGTSIYGEKWQRKGKLSREQLEIDFERHYCKSIIWISKRLIKR